MRSLDLAIESLTTFLRRTVKRGSWLWHGLRGIRMGFIALRRNPVNRRRWQLHEWTFEETIKKYSEEAHPFFVIQVGACDGVIADPIHKWIRGYGWNGVLIEPQKEEFQRLTRTYSGCKGLSLENVAIADAAGLRPLYKVKDEKIEADWQRGLASLVPRTNVGDAERITTEMVECITFTTLLERYHVTHIDLLQIDAEGYDYELLKLFDFGRIKPRLIRYEHKHLRSSDQSSCKGRLREFGYKILDMQHDTGAVLK